MKEEESDNDVTPSEDNVKSTVQENKITKPMPLGLKIVISIIMFLSSLYLSVSVIDILITEAILINTKIETQARITSKEINKGKSGKSYYITYYFNIGNKNYERKLLFGLFTKQSKINRTDFESLSGGSSLGVIYSSISPLFNRPKDDPFKYDKLFLFCIGAIVFGVVSINEFRSLNKKK